jgi:hypothetical protein
VAARPKGSAIWAPRLEPAPEMAVASSDATATAPHAAKCDDRKGDAGLALVISLFSVRTTARMNTVTCGEAGPDRIVGRGQQGRTPQESGGAARRVLMQPLSMA